MRVLGIDTYGLSTSVALVGDGIEPAELREDGCAHNELILDMTARVLRAHELSIALLDGIGVTVGPGMFTSLRVGLCLAKALAETHGIPVKGINTLDAFAGTAGSRTRNVIIALDARKGQIYTAAYSAGAVVVGPCVLEPAQLRTHVPASMMSGNITVAGDAYAQVLSELRSSNLNFQTPETAGLGGSVVGSLAMRELATGPADDPALLAPFYVRRTDAELSRSSGQGTTD